jgi:adenylate cyclase
VQLVDQRTHTLFWSDRFGGQLADVFEALDALALRISTAIRFEIYAREAQNSSARPGEEQSDEELISQAGHILLGSKPAEWARSRQLIDNVLQRQPDNFMALAIRGVQAFLEVICGYREITADEGDTGLRLVRRAIEVNERSDFAHCVLGYIRLYYQRDIEAARREAMRSLELNPNYLMSMDLLGAALIFAGKPEAGVARCAKAAEFGLRLPTYTWFMEDIALGHFAQTDYDNAIKCAEQADHRQSGVPRCLLILTTASWHAARPDLARETAARLLRAYPDFRMSDVRRWPFRDPEPWRRFIDGLVEAGLPA